MEKSVVDKLVKFFSQYPQKTVKLGTVFLDQTQEPTGVYFLFSGTVRQFIATDTGNEVITTLFKPFAFFPMPWATGAAKTRYSYKALSDVVFSIAPKDSVLSLLQSDPQIQSDLLKRVLSGLDAVTTRMTYLMSRTAYDRVILELIFMTKRFGKLNITTGVQEYKLVQQDLGNQTGLTRETVNRELNKLKKKNLITLEKTIVSIPSLLNLEAELDKGNSLRGKLANEPFTD